MQLPRTGDELIEAFLQRWRWFVYRVRFHPWTTQTLPQIFGVFAEYAQLMRLDRPIGIWLLLWPTLWGLWIAARGRPKELNFIIFVAGVVLMRSAGCVINDYADRSFDPPCEAHQGQAAGGGAHFPQEALVLFALLALSALALVLQLNKLTVLLAVVGALLAVSYPFIKRFLSVPQLYLGLSFGWGIRWHSRRNRSGCRASPGCCSWRTCFG